MRLVKIAAFYINGEKDVYLNMDNILSIENNGVDYSVELVNGLSYSMNKESFNKILKASFIKENNNAKEKDKKKSKSKKKEKSK